MPLSAGTCLGPYEIVGPLGAGGMGEVYRARDTRIGRAVAIKTLPPALSGDPGRRSRFEREARAIGALTHPHICTLHDVGRHEGLDFLVMELLEGETLAARIERGPMALAEALACAIQIADALDRAHRQGIVHRDLKPANVMLTRPGRTRSGPAHAKLLDFGLAGLRAETAPGASSVTETTPLTMDGAVFGTLPYMAPEQLEGRPSDHRADLFAFGAMLFEMLTGRRAFDGSSQAGLIGAILHESPPPVTRLAPGMPPQLEHLVAICLAREPEDRWSTAHDVLLQLKWIADHPGDGPAVPVRQSRRRGRIAWSAAAAAALAAVTLAGLLAMRAPGPPATVDILSVLPPEQTSLAPGEAPQISPDGRRVAFVATDHSGRRGIYVRSLDSAAARFLEGTDDAALPFWAPDSRRLGFFAHGQIRTTSIAGGAPQTLAPAPVPRGGTWSREDVILFTGVPTLPPYRVLAAGGEATPVLAAEGTGFRWFPTFLPDGRHYLYLQLGPARTGVSIHVAAIDSLETRELVRSTSGGAYGHPGYLLFRRGPTLLAQRFDSRTLQLSGSPAPIAENVGFNAVTYQALFSVSASGVLAYHGAEPSSQLVWFDREGRRLGAAAPPASHNTLCMAADEKRVVYDVADPVTGVIDLWALDLDQGSSSRLTFEPAADFYPVCSPTGEDIVFASLRGGPPNLFRQTTLAPGSERALMQQGSVPRIPTDWSRDGRLLVYSVLNRQTSWDIEVLPLAGGPAVVFAATGAEERHARLSPDGRFMAYVSNESGSHEVYVQPFPPTGAKWQVSRGGGLQPQWRRDGRELYYLGPERRLIGVDVLTPDSDFRTGATRALLDTRITGWEPVSQGGQYAVTADGQRILVSTETDTVRPITLMLDWPAGLGR